MSRILIKNLPNSANEAEIKSHFADIDTVTDVQLKLNERGESRRFAFIGFRSSEGAQKAIDSLNNTFIKNSKITIEPCKQIRDIKPEKVLVVKNDESSKATLSYKAGESNKKDNKTKAISKSSGSKFESMKNDPQFQEFLSLQRNLEENIKSKHIWADDVDMQAIDNPSALNNDDRDNDVEKIEQDGEHKKKRHKRSRGKKNKASADGKTKPKELFENTIKVQGFPNEIKRRQIIEFFKPNQIISFRNNKRHQVCYVSFKTDRDMKAALRKNLHFYETSRIKIFKHNVKRTKVFNDMIEEKKQQKDEMFKKYDQSMKEVEGIEESGRLFIRNLNYTCRSEDLEEVFKKYGEITDIHFPVDKTTSVPKGYAFVEFMFPDDAKKAYEELNGTIFQGRNFHLIPSKPKPEIRHALILDKQGAFIRKDNPAKERQDKLAPGGSNWNTLFLGQNAVAELGAEAENVDKGQFLTKQTKKEPIAVRMALADTAAVDETKKFLISNGIELDSFNNPQSPRSRTVIIVKNLPAKVTKMELSNLFELYGKVSRVLFPPRGLTAIVEMDDSTEAKRVFKKLSHYKLHDSLLYLEWAPINVFREKNVDEQDRQDVEELRKMQTGTKILVKNVPFEATPNELRKIFAAFGEINFIRFVKKLDGHHRGFAFVDFLTREDALRAFSSLCQSTHLYGRRLVLEWAKSDGDNSNNKNKSTSSSSSAPKLSGEPSIKKAKLASVILN